MTLKIADADDGMEVMVDCKVPAIIERVTELIVAEGGRVRSVSPRAGRLEVVLSSADTADHVRALEGVRLVRPIRYESHFAL